MAPEVVQSSAMDCGPAALKCLLAGHGIAASYDRLREACQTDVDGTSIDTLEQVAVALGLEAEQVMIPADHLLLAGAAALPALVVVRNPIGSTHFVVVWNRIGSWVQVMDPASGRRWTSARALHDELFLHALAVPAAAWREWAGSEDFLRPLAQRLAELGFGRRETGRLIEIAEVDEGWFSLAALDAAVRLTDSLARGGGARRGSEAKALLRALLQRSAADETAVPDAYWSVRPSRAAGGEEELLLSGAVLVRVRGRRTGADFAEQEAELRRLSPELAAAVEAERQVAPLRGLLAFLGASGKRALALVGFATFVAAAGIVLEVVFFRGLLDLGLRLALAEQRAVAMLGLLVFLASLMLVEIGVVDTALRTGRELEVRLRIRFLDKLARLGERYFHSRLSSDMAERCHSVHRLRLGGEWVGWVLRSGFQLLFLVIGISWVDPGSAPLAVLSGLVTLLLPVWTQPLLAERDLRMRSHVGALGRFYLDALLGLLPIRSHAAEGAMRSEHEGLLREWMSAALRRERAALWLDIGQSFFGYGFAVWILLRHLWLGSDATQVLLLAYWAMNIPMRGQELALLAHQLPQIRNTALRLLEPLGAPDEAVRTGRANPEPEGTPDATGRSRSGASIALCQVEVVAAGHRILTGVDLEVASGTSVAIVGPSGAGKSTLMGLLLGRHRAATGEVRIDGRALDPATLDRLRATTAWVDPAVQIWNRPLLDNVLYGASPEAAARLVPVLDAALLRQLLQALPEGWQTPLGECGALVSGGEGQRVRLARSLLRHDARLALLDEPFRGLDRETRRALLDAARSWWRGATLLCITHDIAHTADFDRVLVMEAGCIVEDGAPASLAATPSSRYGAMLARERESQRHLRRAAAWRHLGLEDGMLREDLRQKGSYAPREVHR
jgi:ABC-type bacteriocin/lantibiotic exporter with double-glycine peptidase domain